MNQLFAIALGGSFGALLRFLVSTGVYHWLGRGFPFGTLVVNILGSFLLGLLTEALVLNRMAFALDYRAAILVGFIGAFTTFSTFSLETVYLLQQSHFVKAAMNISISVAACLLAIWLGLLCGKALTGKAVIWADGMFPYGIISVNALGALLISLVASLLLPKIPMTIEHQLTLLVVIVGAYLSFSGLYVLLYLLEHGYTHTGHTRVFLMGFIGNTGVCVLVMCLGWWVVNRLDALLLLAR